MRCFFFHIKCSHLFFLEKLCIYFENLFCTAHPSLCQGLIQFSSHNNRSWWLWAEIQGFQHVFHLYQLTDLIGWIENVRNWAECPALQTVKGRTNVKAEWKRRIDLLHMRDMQRPWIEIVFITSWNTWSKRSWCQTLILNLVVWGGDPSVWLNQILSSCMASCLWSGFGSRTVEWTVREIKVCFRS